MGLPLLAVPGGRVEFLDIPAGDIPAGDIPPGDVPAGEVRGGRDRAPLLLLHEGLGSVGLWRGFPERLAAATGRRTVAYSRLGHGGSDAPPAPRTPSSMHEEAATVVPALRDALGLAAPVLVGHSDGGSIALLHAAWSAGGTRTGPAWSAGGTRVGPAAHDVTGLVVLAPHVLVEESGLVAIRAAREAFETGDLRARLARRHRDPDAAFHGWNDVWLDPAFRAWDLRPELPAVRCPVLAVQGTADPYGTLVHVEAVRELASGPVELLVLGGGHSPHLEEPDRVEAAVVGFLRGLP